MKPRLHFHSDCATFAGCENMLANFFQDDQLLAEFDVSFSYRQSAAYDDGYRRRVTRPLDVRPLALKDVAVFNAASHKLPVGLGWLVRVAAHLLLLRYWYLAWNVLLLYRAIDKVQLVHINNGNYPGAYSCMAAVFAARLRGVKSIVYVVNNMAISYADPRRWLDYPFDRMVAHTVTVFVTASRQAGLVLRKVLRLNEAKVVGLHNGIAPRKATEDPGQTRQRLAVPAGRVLIGMVAVLEKRKGHRVLLESLARMKKQIPGHMPPFIILEGTGSESDAIHALVEELGLANDVRMIGNEPNVFNLLNAVDALVLPSIAQEDFPNVVLEAMSLGKPVIGSRLAGIPEQILDMECGVLVEPGDSCGLAEAMGKINADPALRERLGRSARQRFVEQFTAEAAVGRYRALYHRLLADQMERGLA
jgi:glycosyltransferase involved in cell wall biosynthesis